MIKYDISRYLKIIIVTVVIVVKEKTPLRYYNMNFGHVNDDRVT